MTATAILSVISRAEAKANGLKRYFTGDPCVHGHVAERSIQGVCVECNRLRAGAYYHANADQVQERAKARYKASPEARRAYSKKWAKENQERVKEFSVEYYAANKEKIKQRSRDWGQDNAKRKQARNAAWNAANPEKARAHQREYDRRRLASDPVFALRARIQCSIRNSLIKGGYTKRSRTHEYLGCSFEEFKIHIEKQFLKGMTWENRSLWHLDHVTPVSSAKTEDEMAALHHFTNLRPLWAKDNQSKGDKIEFLI